MTPLVYRWQVTESRDGPWLRQDFFLLGFVFCGGDELLVEKLLQLCELGCRILGAAPHELQFVDVLSPLTTMPRRFARAPVSDNR
jgi:hypothetical protein